jgi:hypothetical protein
MPRRVHFSYPFQESDHITLQEVKTVKTALIDMASKVPNHHTSQICVGDSAAARGTFAKGRSSSYRMNLLLKQTAPFLIAADLRPGFFWDASEDNPADDLTRQRDLRAPLASADWLERIGPEGLGDSFCPGADAVAAGPSSAWVTPCSQRDYDYHDSLLICITTVLLWML